ncbi:response regulator [Maribacter sp. 2307UL18-2]|uniref:response regulator n=1 Tax=Maribacter sp. 2307UL18-2 TaxID=3386274 RepID=UPI0039BCDB89
MIASPIKSVVLIDDDEISNLFNKIFIRRLDLDIEIETVANGAKAIALLTDQKTRLEKPLLLLLDMRMPVMDGWKFLEAYDSLDEELRNESFIAVLTTSENEKEMISATKNPNIDAIIRKPLSEKKFTGLIQKLFIRKKKT